MCQLKSCAHFQSETLRAVRILRFQSLSTCRHPRFSFLPFFSPFSLLRNFLFPNSYPPTALPSTPAFRATGRPPRSHATVRPGGAGPRSSGGLSRRGSRPEVRLLAPFPCDSLSLSRLELLLATRVSVEQQVKGRTNLTQRAGRSRAVPRKATGCGVRRSPGDGQELHGRGRGPDGPAGIDATWRRLRSGLQGIP